MGGVDVRVRGLAKSFGNATVWSDVSLTLPAGEISVLLGPSGTGKSVLLKSIIGLLRPERGSVVIHDTDLLRCSTERLYEIRKRIGVLFQDGALFGSMTLFDNVAFPLREHTRATEARIRKVVAARLEMVGLAGAGTKFPAEISGGMRKRAGLARALVLDPEIILVDEPDSGLDPVRTAYLNQLLIDVNAQLDATMLVVTHHLGTARTLPDNIGMLYRRELVMFAAREVLLTSEEPAVSQFLQGRRAGPIGMSEEKDVAQVRAELAELEALRGTRPAQSVEPQLTPSPGLPERQAARRRLDRVMRSLAILPPRAREAVLASLSDDDRVRYGVDAPREPRRSDLVDLRGGS